ncbi:MAG: hypothetical protein ACP5VP_04945 [Candidatus Limnocylindrales bacterium]
MHWQRSGPAHKPAAGGVDQVEPVKHVIAEYQHRLHHVTCTCGWEGSSLDNDPAGWKAHLAATRRPHA